MEKEEWNKLIDQLLELARALYSPHTNLDYLGEVMGNIEKLKK